MMNGRSDKNPTSDDRWDGREMFPDEAPDLPYPSEEELIRLIFASHIDAFALFGRLIAEWNERRLEAKHEIQQKLDWIALEDDTFTRAVLTGTLKISEPGERMREAISQIQRLNRLKGTAERIFGIEAPARPRELSSKQIEQARSVPILDVISRVLEIKKRGKSHVGLCPFHQDKNPSFHVYPQQNRFYCFGCQKGGDAIAFIRLHYRYGFKKAIEYLIGGFQDD